MDATHKLKVSCKRKAEADFNSPPGKVIRRELQAFGGETDNTNATNIINCRENARQDMESNLPQLLYCGDRQLKALEIRQIVPRFC